MMQKFKSQKVSSQSWVERFVKYDSGIRQLEPPQLLRACQISFLPQNYLKSICLRILLSPLRKQNISEGFRSWLLAKPDEMYDFRNGSTSILALLQESSVIFPNLRQCLLIVPDPVVLLLDMCIKRCLIDIC